MTDDDPPRRAPAHEIGQPVDRLSLHEFDERIEMLREEITRLEAARDRKRVALDVAGSIFGRR